MKKRSLLLTTALTVAMVTTTIAQSIPSYVPTNGLVGWWPFNGNANDESGNGNNGTVNGATLTSDRFGNSNAAFDFDGLSNYIECVSNSILQFSNSYSISLWFKSNNFNNGQYGYTLLSKIASTGWYGGYEIMIGENNSIGGVNHTGNINGNFQLPYSGMNIGSWYSVVVTYDGNQLKLFVDGILVNTLNRPGSIQTGNDPLRFGRRGGGGIYDQWYDGKLDDIGIWNRALTQQEVSNLYTTSTPSTCLPSYVPTNGLVGYWPFCGNANDESGNGNNASINNATQGSIVYNTDRSGNQNSCLEYINPQQWNADGAYVSLPSSMPFSFLSDFSFVFWAKPTVFNTPCELINKGRDNSGAFWSRFSNGFFQTGSNLSNLSYLDATLYNNWRQYSIVKSGTILKRYSNGILIDSMLFQGPNNSSIEFWIGKHNEQGQGNGSTYPYVGFLDDIGIWNRALSQQEITNLFNGSNTSGLGDAYSETNFEVYPNPAENEINFSFKKFDLSKSSSIKIINSLGQQVYQQKITKDFIRLSTAELGDSGVYVVLVIDAKGNSVLRKKFIIN